MGYIDLRNQRPSKYISAREMGVVANGTSDDTVAFNKTLARAKAMGVGNVELPGGTMKITDTAAVGVSDMSGLRIIGNGTRLLFSGIDSSEYPASGDSLFGNFTNIDGLRIEDVSLDTEYRAFTQVECTAISAGTSVDVDIDPDFPVNWSTVGTMFEIEATEFSPAVKNSYRHGSEVGDVNIALVSGNTYRLSGANLDTNDFTVGKLYVLFHKSNLLRTFRFHNCKNIIFDNVEHITGSGAIYQNCENIDISGYKMRRRNGIWMPSGQDVYHIKNWRGFVRWNGGIAHGAGDDIFNAHTDQVNISSVDDANTITGTISINADAYTTPDFRVGDTWRFYAADGTFVEDNVCSAFDAASATTMTVEFESALNGSIDNTYYCVNLSAVGTLDAGNNDFGYCMGHGIVAQGRRMNVNGNRARRIARMAVDLVPYSYVFNEGPPGEDSIVKDNLASWCGTYNVWAGTDRAVFQSGMKGFGNETPTDQQLASIVFDGNVAMHSEIGCVSVFNVINPTVTNNRAIDVCRDPRETAAGYPFSMAYCSDGIFNGNSNQSSTGTSELYTLGNTGKILTGNNPGVSTWITYAPAAPFTFATPGDLALSSISQTNRYRRVADNMVEMEFDMQAVATFTTASGEFRVSIPTACKAGVLNTGTIYSVVRIALVAGRTQFVVRASQSNSYMIMNQIGSDVTSALTVTAAEITSGDTIRVQGRIIYEEA